MDFFLRTLRLLSIAFWVGGIAFFAFVVAPVAFARLPNPHEAGLIVRGSILPLHRIGFVCGLMFLCASVVLLNRARNRRSSLALQILLIILMLIATLISQKKVLPAMEVDRVASAGIFEELGPEDPHRIDFERLHILSERLEGAIFLFGIAILILMAREEPTAR